MTSFWIARLTFDHLLSQLFYRPNYISWPCECSGFAQKSDITKLSESSLFRSHIKENVGCEEIGTSRKAIVFNKKHDNLEDDNSDKDSLKEEKENQGGAGQGQGGQGGEDGGQHAPSPFSMLQAKLEQVLIAIVVPIVFIPIVFVTIVIISSAIKF